LVAVLRQDHATIAGPGKDAADWLFTCAEPEAHQAVRELRRDPARQWGIALALEGGAAPLAVVRDAGYVPGGGLARAASLSLTEQWELYPGHDFDGRLLAAHYAASQETERERLRALASRHGHAALTPLVLIGDRQARAGRLTRAEATYLLDALISDG